MQSDLNEKQKEAVCLGLGPAMILAGPGSGKTTVIVERIKHLIYEKNISPQSILVITFTKAAAMEMEKRAANLLNKSNNGPIFGTIHSFFFNVLKRSYEYQNFTILTSKQKYRNLEHLLKDNYPYLRISNHFLQDILSVISREKNQMDISKEIEKLGFSREQFDKIKNCYDNANYQKKMMDYDDILLLAHKFLQENQLVLHMLRNEVKYILVDEFQDINAVQYELLHLLAKREGNIFVVGDDDQSIYRFRGAGEENFRRFETDFPSVKKVILNINYRCPKEIVKLSSKLIEHNEKRFFKDLTSLKKEKGNIVCKRFLSKKEEQKYLTKEVKELALKKRKVAVLCRTNSQLAVLAERLKKLGVKFFIKEKMTSFYELPHIMPIIGYLMYAAKTDRSRKRVLTFLNKPMRYIERDFLKECEEHIVKLATVSVKDKRTSRRLYELEKALELIAGMKPEIALAYILKVLGYERYLLENAVNTDQIRQYKENLIELKERAGMYESIQEWMEMVKWEEELKENSVCLENTDNTYVYLYTFHGAKGLEFETVWIPHLNEGSVPYGKNLKKDELEEERRMFYVALTRSCKNLYVTFVENDTKKDTASRFLKESEFTVSK